MNLSWKTKSRFSLLVLFIITFELCLFISPTIGRTVNIPGFYIKDQIYPNEVVFYNFSNNITLGVSSDVFIDIEIDYENRIENRQILFKVNNSLPIYLNITSKINMNNFGMTKPPDNPKRSNYRFQYQYNCIFQLRSNITIDTLTILTTR